MQKWFSFKDSNYLLPKQSNNTLTSIPIKHDSSEATIEVQETPHAQKPFYRLSSLETAIRVSKNEYRHDATDVMMLLHMLDRLCLAARTSMETPMAGDIPLVALGDLGGPGSGFPALSL